MVSSLPGKVGGWLKLDAVGWQLKLLRKWADCTAQFDTRFCKLCWRLNAMHGGKEQMAETGPYM